VKDTFKERETYSRLDGRSNVSLTITKRAGSNLIEIAENIRVVIAEMEPEMPANTEVVILSDESENIRDMVKELENNMITGLLLVIIVIMVAMGLRNSVLVGVAIPLSMMITFLVLQLLGITLNMVVLFSLILALGMLVDNGIVIVENIYRHASMGKTVRQAALEGTAEVAWPVATSTFTTVAAFLPLMFWPGIIGEFMGYLPKTLIITLLASLLVALVITPVLCAAFLRVNANGSVLSDEAEDSAPDGSTLGGRILIAYERLLRGAIGHRWITVMTGGAVFVLTIVLYVSSGLGVEFFPETPPERIIISVDAGDGTRVGLTNRVVGAIEAQIQGDPNIKHYVATVGQSGGGGGFSVGGGKSPHRGQVSIDFVDAAEQTAPINDVINDIRNRIADIPGARIEISKQQDGPPSGAPVNIEIRGEDLRVLERTVEEVKAIVSAVEGVVDLKDNFSSGRPEVRIEVDREKAGLVKASTSQIGDVVRAAINGVEASKIRDGEDEYDIRVRLNEADRKSLKDLETLRIRVNDPDFIRDANLVPIVEIASLVQSGGTGSIRHKEKVRLATVSGNTEGRLTNEVMDEIREKLAEYPLPAGFTFSFTGEQEDQAESQAFLGGAFLLALFLIALILVTQFNSVFLPAIIMLAVILSLIGVFWGQMIVQLPFGVIMTGLGVISLAGVVVNNAIVLVDYIQQLRDRGLPRDEALVRAGLIRLRPVLLTAITTVLGLVPMALKISVDFSSLSIQQGGSSSAFWYPMAIAVIFGLAIATVLTLVVVPTLYSMFDDFEGLLKRVFRGKASRNESMAGAGEPSPAARAPNV
ncbi:MAG: efflux RND transporter permease subunit, partial [Myxococcota bacterium]